MTPAWFDIENQRMSDEDEEDEAGIRRMTEEIHATLDKEKLPSEKILLMGFGIGGAIAIHAGLSYHRPIAGVVSFSGYVPLPDEYPEHIHESNAKTPVLALHGKQDDTIPHLFAKERYDVLKAAGIPVDYRADPRTPHVLLMDSLFNTIPWWYRVLKEKNVRRVHQITGSWHAAKKANKGWFC